jgi:hypothetical protein
MEFFSRGNLPDKSHAAAIDGVERKTSARDLAVADFLTVRIDVTTLIRVPSRILQN